MNITWSGYNGTHGHRGNEYITITGETSEMLVMKVFGYQAGEADVTYSWGNAQSNTLQTLKNVYKPTDTVNVKVDGTLSGDRDWVGIFPKNAAINGNNVVAWGWIPRRGTFVLNTKLKPMPAGEYVVKLFFHNSYHIEATYEFQVAAGNDYESAGPYEVKRYPEVGLENGEYVVYYPENAITKDMPVVLFLEGGGSGPKIQDYKGIMKYLASRGYFVIGGETGAGYGIKNYVHIFEGAINVAKNAHELSIKKLAVMGHSQGGGSAFYTMKYFQDKGYGIDASLVLSIDGWFAFDMNQTNLQSLKGDVRFLQMNGLEGTGTDPRIKLSIWNLASQTDRKFLTLPEDDHSYVKGDFNQTMEKKDLIHIVGALCDDTFNPPSSSGYDSIDNARKTTFNEIKEALKDKEQYSGDCAGVAYNAREGELKYYDIDYCEDYNENKYPNTIQLENVQASTYDMSKPAEGETVVDDVLGTKITQVEKGDLYRSAYPKVQSWNKDMTLLRIGYRIYDAHTYTETDITKGKSTDDGYVKLCGGVSSYARWSHNDPNKFFVMNNSSTASYTPKFTIGTIEGNNVHCERRDIFNDFELVYMTLEEGNIDNNDQYVAMLGKKKNDLTMYVILYDIRNNQRIWAKQFDLDDKWYKRWNDEQHHENGFVWMPFHLDWITVTPSGQRIVAMVDHHYEPEERGIYVYDMNLSNRMQLKYKNDNGDAINAIPQHGDIGYDVDGHEVFVQYMTHVGIYMYNLENPNKLGTAVIKSSYLSTGHIGCRNTRRPGWCYVSPYDQDRYGYVFALKLKAIEDANSDNEKENVQLFSRTFKTNPNYYYAFASASPDGTKVIFNTEDGGTFVAEVQ